MEPVTPSASIERPRPSHSPLWELLFILALIAGGIFRISSVHWDLNWDESQHLHPDERFLTMVEAAISPVNSVSEYFDTAHSTLNPNNVGYGFYVYGTLPLFMVRYVSEWTHQTGYDQVFLVGRWMSTIMDLLTTILVYLCALRLFRDRRIASLAGAFYALSVLPIQLSHYWTTDSFLCFFGFLTFYIAVWVMTATLPKPAPRLAQPVETATVEAEPQPGAQVFPAPEPLVERPQTDLLASLNRDWGSVWRYIAFGLAVGAAASSKISAGLAAILLPAAAIIWWSRLPKDQRDEQSTIIIRNLIIAGVVAFLAFRVFQPYAFSGPSFFGIKPNQLWINNIKELGVQSTGDVDFPPALQWARRPVTFAWQNMIEWGLGIPLGLLAWGGFLWMVWRIFKGNWRNYSLIVGWTAAYSLWWGLNFSRTMRYQILVYPTLAMIAGWALIALWEKGVHSAAVTRRQARLNQWSKIAAVVLGVVVLLGTFAWAFAFMNVYTRTMTRVAASRWIYANVPGPINLKLNTGDTTVNQPLAYRAGFEVDTGMRWVLAFRSPVDGTLAAAEFGHIMDLNQDIAPKTVIISVKSDPNIDADLTTTYLSDAFLNQDDARGNSFRAEFQNPLNLTGGKTYYLVITVQNDRPHALSFAGVLDLQIGTSQGTLTLPLPPPVDALVGNRNMFTTAFNPVDNGVVSEISFPHLVDFTGDSGNKTVVVSLADQPVEGTAPLATASMTGSFNAGPDLRGKAYTFTLDHPVALKKDTTYYLSVTKTDGLGEIGLYGSRTALESSWDDPLPLGMDGFNAFDPSTGLFPTELNFEMYWDDNPDKLQRFLSILNQTDYIFITSNRQWGTTVRVPERYPLTTYYYRNLIGCPDTESIINCYADAQPGMFQSKLGFELIKTFQNNPTIGPVQINDQYAEEAFTVYDHPKVLIFKKTANYDSVKVMLMLSSVDLTDVVHVTPRKAGSYPGNLLLPADRLAEQREGGTWSQLFDLNAAINKYPGLAVVLWYLVISLLGWVVYPFVRLALHGLPDRGYPLTKLIGMLLLAFFTWLLGSANIPVNKPLITLVALVLLGGGLIFAYLQRDELLEEWRERKGYFLTVELVALLFFAIDLGIRYGNPDLWHPYKGGEKPMDFSYLNAVIKSTTFPPYDPWFAGGYINYYYFGFVIVGVPIKWLGIEPSIAYNIFLPTFFSFLTMGAFSFAWNIFAAFRKPPLEGEEPRSFVQKYRNAIIAGIVAAVLLLILGNEGTVRQIWHGFMRLAAPDGNDAIGNIFQRITWTIQGIGKVIAGAKMPYPPGDWYWIPSRVYPHTEITEFPFFTFLYGDPHAHMFALPLTTLALTWALSILLGRWRWGISGDRLKVLHYASTFLLGGLVIGSLRPVNTWDLPTYLVIAVVAILYTVFRYGDTLMGGFYEIPVFYRRILTALLSVVLLVGLSFLLYQPYARWYATSYNSLELWKGDRSPFWSYITHWGLFLFLIVSWMVWETRDWMASTPVSSLNKLKPYQLLIIGLVLMLLAALVGLAALKVQIGWVALPLAAWALLLIIRPGQSDIKRAILFMIGSGLTLTLFVEVFRLAGDIDRMNTVFKFYLQAWTLLSISAAASLVWLWPAMSEIWTSGWRNSWSVVLTLLLFGAFLYPVMAGWDKITDRMAKDAPHTLDGMTYMQYATYSDHDVDMKLVQDYNAIRWMQEYVQGSPVIVEANQFDLYRWGNRYTIYTGLPDVVGWDWHQRQQRSVVPGEWVTNRVNEIANFYLTTDPVEAQAFLKKYQAKYIVVGQLEQAIYPGPGLDKFAQYNGKLWKQVYHQDQTTIYEVLP